MPKWSLVLGFTARIAQISLSSKIQAKGRAVGETVDVWIGTCGESVHLIFRPIWACPRYKNEVMIEWTGKPSNEEPCHFWDPLSKDLDSWTSDAAAKFLSPLNPAYPNRSFLISQVPQEFISSKNSKSWNAFASTNRLLFPGSPLCSIPRLTFLDFPTYTRIYIYTHIYILCIYRSVFDCSDFGT